MGTVTSGHLIRGKEIPLVGPHHQVMEEHSKRRTNYATSELVDLILGGAALVAQAFPESKLPVANAARPGGGNLPWSISHNSGRDIDLVFYLVDESGASVVPRTMAPLAPPDGTLFTDGRTLRFDPRRTWILVNHFLESKTPEVQYIFMADFLIELMFQYARSQGIANARLKALRPRLRQPRGTLPHDDHMHMRIRCSPEDLLEGCRDIVNGREIVPEFDSSYQRRVQRLLLLYKKAQTPQERAPLAEMLGLLKARKARGILIESLSSCEEPLCLASLRALKAMEVTPSASTLVAVIGGTENLDTAKEALRLLRGCSSGETREVLKLLAVERTLTHERASFEETLNVREQACFVLGQMGKRTRSTFKPLVALLRSADPKVSAAALWAIRVLAAAPVFGDLGEDDFDGLWKRFKSWYAVNRNRTTTFSATLRALGHDVTRHLSQKGDARVLVPLILEEDYLSINAQLALQDLIGHRVPVDVFDKLSTHWLIRKEWKSWRRHH